MRVLLLLFLTGCTLAVPSPCDPDACPGNDGCHADGYCIEGRCFDDGECKAGFVCQTGDCIDLCDDDDCERGYVCDTERNACHEDCDDNDACTPERYCCTPEIVDVRQACTTDKLYECVE